MKSAKLSIAVFIKWVFHSQHHCILVHSRKSKCLWLWSLSTALTCSSALFHFSALCWNWVFPISLYPALSSSVMDFHFSASMSLISFIELFGLPRSSFGYSSFGRQHIHMLVVYVLVWEHHSLDFPDLVLPFTFASIPSSILCEHFGHYCWEVHSPLLLLPVPVS